MRSLPIDNATVWSCVASNSLTFKAKFSASSMAAPFTPRVLVSRLAIGYGNGEVFGMDANNERLWNKSRQISNLVFATPEMVLENETGEGHNIELHAVEQEKQTS